MVNVNRSWSRKLPVLTSLLPRCFPQKSMQTSQIYPRTFFFVIAKCQLYFPTLGTVQEPKFYRNSHLDLEFICQCLLLVVLPCSGLNHQHKTSPCTMTVFTNTLPYLKLPSQVLKLPFSCLFASGKTSQMASQKLQEAANVTISQYTRGHSPLNQLHGGSCKGRLDYHCPTSGKHGCCSPHIYFHY